MLAKIKNSFFAAHRLVGVKHLPRYLGAFAWRFNRRFVLKTIASPSRQRQRRQCPTASSNWLRLDGKQVARYGERAGSGEGLHSS
jgi:hypothetical protein